MAPNSNDISMATAGSDDERSMRSATGVPTARRVSQDAMLQPDSTEQGDLAPSPFLELPPEMRNDIYGRIFIPRTISLRTYANHTPSAIVPDPDLGFTLVNRHVHSETKNYYSVNEYIVNVSLDPQADRIIPSEHLSDSNILRVERLVLVLDLNTIHPSTPTAWDFDLLGDLAALSSLTVCATARAADIHLNGNAPYIIQKVLEEILQYLPSSCKVTYGPLNPEMKHHIDDLVVRHWRNVGLNGLFSYHLPQFVDATRMRTIAGPVQVEKGGRNLAQLKKSWKTGEEELRAIEEKEDRLEEYAIQIDGELDELKQKGLDKTKEDREEAIMNH